MRLAFLSACWNPVLVSGCSDFAAGCTGGHLGILCLEHSGDSHVKVPGLGGAQGNLCSCAVTLDRFELQCELESKCLWPGEESTVEPTDSPWRIPCWGRWMSKGTCDPIRILFWSRPWALDPWKGSTLEQFLKYCTLCEKDTHRRSWRQPTFIVFRLVWRFDLDFYLLLMFLFFLTEIKFSSLWEEGVCEPPLADSWDRQNQWLRHKEWIYVHYHANWRSPKAKPGLHKCRAGTVKLSPYIRMTGLLFTQSYQELLPAVFCFSTHSPNRAEKASPIFFAKICCGLYWWNSLKYKSKQNILLLCFYPKVYLLLFS